MKREEAIATKIKMILDSITTANGYQTNFDGKYLFESSLSPQSNTIEFNIKYPKSYREEYKEIMDFEINLACKKMPNNLSALENAKVDILSALISSIDDLRAIFGGVLKWLDFGYEPIIQVEGEAEIAEASISISLLHRVTEKQTIDLTDYSTLINLT